MTSHRIRLIIGGGLAAAFLVAATVLATLAIAKPGEQAEAAGAVAATPAAATAAWTAPEPTATTPGSTLRAADLKLTPKITKKQCFGSAGCHVTVKVEVGYGGPALPEDETWQVTFEVTGDESGPIIESFELTGGRYDQDEIDMSTKSGKTKISVKVTDVELIG